MGGSRRGGAHRKPTLPGVGGKRSIPNERSTPKLPRETTRRRRRRSSSASTRRHPRPRQRDARIGDGAWPRRRRHMQRAGAAHACPSCGRTRRGALDGHIALTDIWCVTDSPGCYNPCCCEADSGWIGPFAEDTSEDGSLAAKRGDLPYQRGGTTCGGTPPRSGRKELAEPSSEQSVTCRRDPFAIAQTRYRPCWFIGARRSAVIGGSPTRRASHRHLLGALALTDLAAASVLSVVDPFCGAP